MAKRKATVNEGFVHCPGFDVKVETIKLTDAQYKQALGVGLTVLGITGEIDLSKIWTRYEETKT